MPDLGKWNCTGVRKCGPQCKMFQAIISYSSTEVKEWSRHQVYFARHLHSFRTLGWIFKGPALYQRAGPWRDTLGRLLRIRAKPDIALVLSKGGELSILQASQQLRSTNLLKPRSGWRLSCVECRRAVRATPTAILGHRI